ncbi:MAG: hypothetical protein BGO05_20485 [Rhizobiales bacterium 63-7]|nr:MAG: hypothetical protein BGO05_20485 [Rhizobiales bacterium 63-7]
MAIDTPKTGAPGTTEQSPRWEGPQENRPRGYLPAEDDPDTARDAVGESNSDPQKRDLGDAFKTADDDASVFDEEPVRLRAYEIWEADGRPEGQHESHWHRALKELGLVSPSEQPDGSTVFPSVKPGL